MQGWMNVREEALNVLLAELLAERGLKALGEVVLKKGYPDVLLDVNGVRIMKRRKRVGERSYVRIVREGWIMVCVIYALWWSMLR